MPTGVLENPNPFFHRPDTQGKQDEFKINVRPPLSGLSCTRPAVMSRQRKGSQLFSSKSLPPGSRPRPFAGSDSLLPLLTTPVLCSLFCRKLFKQPESQLPHGSHCLSLIHSCMRDAPLCILEGCPMKQDSGFLGSTATLKRVKQTRKETDFNI